MRTLIGFVIVAVVAGGFLSQRKKETQVEASPVAVMAKVQPTPDRETSAHNWPKSSLDRAADVKRQVLQERKENGSE